MAKRRRTRMAEDEPVSQHITTEGRHSEEFQRHFWTPSETALLKTFFKKYGNDTGTFENEFRKHGIIDITRQRIKSKLENLREWISNEGNFLLLHSH